MLASPLGLGSFGRVAVALELGVDLVGELGVFGEGGLDKGAGKAEDIDRPADPFVGGDVPSNEAVDELPDVGAADEVGAPACGSIAEAHGDGMRHDSGVVTSQLLSVFGGGRRRQLVPRSCH